MKMKNTSNAIILTLLCQSLLLQSACRADMPPYHSPRPAPPVPVPQEKTVSKADPEQSAKPSDRKHIRSKTDKHAKEPTSKAAN
jgi:hypothetical protein